MLYVCALRCPRYFKAGSPRRLVNYTRSIAPQKLLLVRSLLIPKEDWY